MSDAYGRLERYLRGWSDLPDAELAKVRQVFRPSAEPRGALLVRAGDRPQRVCFIVRGLVRIFHADPDGTERTQGFRAEDQLVCAYSAMLLGGPARLSVQALEPCSLLSASVTAFGELCRGHPAWQRLTARITESLYLQQEERQRELLLDDATTRYTRFVAEQPALAHRLTQRQIASYVGVTPVALSRIRARLISVNDSGVRRS